MKKHRLKYFDLGKKVNSWYIRLQHHMIPLSVKNSHGFGVAFVANIWNSYLVPMHLVSATLQPGLHKETR